MIIGVIEVMACYPNRSGCIYCLSLPFFLCVCMLLLLSVMDVWQSSLRGNITISEALHLNGACTSTEITSVDEDPFVAIDFGRNFSLTYVTFIGKPPQSGESFKDIPLPNVLYSNAMKLNETICPSKQVVPIFLISAYRSSWDSTLYLPLIYLSRPYVF